MLKNTTTLPSPVALISIAVVLVLALGAVAHIKLAPVAPSQPIHAGNPDSSLNPAASVSASPPVSNSVYISEQTLRKWLDDAYERHQTVLVLRFLTILNGRYERRCCGLPF